MRLIEQAVNHLPGRCSISHLKEEQSPGLAIETKSASNHVQGMLHPFSLAWGLLRKCGGLGAT